MLRALGAFPVCDHALVHGDRVLRLFRVTVCGGEAGAGGDRIWMISATRTFGVREGALGQRDGLFEPSRLPVRGDEAATGGYGLGVIGPKHPLHSGQPAPEGVD